MSRVKFKNEKDFIEVKNKETAKLDVICRRCGFLSEYSFVSNQCRWYRGDSREVYSQFKCPMCGRVHILYVEKSECGWRYKYVN